MKKRGIILAIFVAALGIGFFLSKNKTAPPPTQASQDAAVAAALARQNLNTVAIIQSNFARVQPMPVNQSTANPVAPAMPAGQPAELQFTNFDPAIVVENMSRAIRQYGQMFGGNPVGNNQEITSQLTGNNPKHINFINAEAGMRLNADGELIDPWGTPYFFHQLSGSDTEIHSAGPDRVMWTSDDVVSH